MPRHAPRLVVTALSGDAGKTLISLGLLLAARERGLAVAAFKKGPDYIDAQWLGWAAGRPARNLDTYLMGHAVAASAFSEHAVAAGLNLIEGNRGLLDGVDAAGSHSTAALATLLEAPIVLIVDAAKCTRTVAAGVRGCQVIAPKATIGGVILNRLGGPRHREICREAVESLTGVPVVGTITRVQDGSLLPGRHLGLIPPAEQDPGCLSGADIARMIREQVDLDSVLRLATSAPPLPVLQTPSRTPDAPDGRGLAVGVVRDPAFSFYYPENLEALETAGVRLVFVSAIDSDGLPHGLDALYIGGGFPETHGRQIASNTSFLSALAGAARAGVAVYAECGGLMLLSRFIRWRGERLAMAGVLPFDVEMHERPQAHGYARLIVDRPNVFFPQGTVLAGHQFHFSWPVEAAASVEAACAVERGTGAFGGRDAVIVHRVWASYTHLHARATPSWTAAMIRAARTGGVQT